MQPLFSRLLAGLAVALLTTHAVAIVNDNGNSPGLPLALDLGGVGLLSNHCSSVLLAGGTHVLAAGHCAAGPGETVSFQGGTVTATIAETIYAPGIDLGAGINDLSISRLAAPVTAVAGYAWATASALPTAIVLAGYGAGGSGASGVSEVGDTLRFGFNDYEELLADDPDHMPSALYDGTVVGFDFDDGSAALSRFGSLGVAGEAGLAPGDSGGPSFALLSGVWTLVGIHNAVADGLGFGFGGIGYDVLVSRYAAWIDGVTAVPEPSTWALMLVGMLAVTALPARRFAGRTWRA